MTYSPTTVANKLLDIAAQRGSSLTPLQLIKLCYMAYGWCLEMYDRRLFNEQPQAWQYGPVIPSIYHKAKQFRDQPIAGHLAQDWFQSAQLGSQEDHLLQQVFDSYARFSGIQLSSMTHQPGTPWHDVWHANGRNAPIPDELIRRHYQEIRQRRG